MMNAFVKIGKAFDKQAAEYEKHALAQKEIGLRLFERLDYLKITPRYVLDIGCGTGFFSDLLKKRYPEAEIVALDLSVAMLQHAKKKQSIDHLIAGNIETLPFESSLFDLVFANQVIHWSNNLPLVFREINRVMQANGCFMFTTLGPDTFKELKQAWKTVDQHAHANDFIDMHDIGDMLLQEKFVDPVVDMEKLTVHYPSVRALVNSLKAQGVKNIHPQRSSGLMGKNAWQAFEKAYIPTENGKFPLQYEVIYGHAWKGMQRIGEKGVETYIPISDLFR